MRDISKRVMRPTRMSYAVSLALATLITGNLAQAQEAKQAPSETSAETPIQQVLVVGTRASQQSSINRKKGAATTQDSIVAEDVGALPDRNVGEAISRIAGIALDRGDYGEGVSVAVRGNGPDLTRVEIDGQGVQAGGGTNLNGGGDGRGVELREMSADLIKSVDVVKGSTADMTEGSLGGGIIIKTRTGLDFKKPFYSLRMAGSQSSLNKEWSPDANLILADKFLDGRLGVLVNASKSSNHNESHSTEVATSRSQGYARAIDFDNSPEKTFTFNPATVDQNDPAATTPALRSALVGGGYFDSSTPLDLVTRSAQAKSKADCYAMFPNLTVAQQNSITAGLTRTGAVNHRGNELMTCLNQWNDYTPSLVRYIVRRQVDDRKNLDLRFDFKVNSDLTVYAKGAMTKRKVDDGQLTYGLGGLSVNPNPNTVLSPGYFGPAYSDSAAGVRTAVPGSGYYAYDNMSFRTSAFPAQGAVANVIPGSVVTDANHHVTKFTITDGSAGTDQIHNITETTSKYFQAGGTFRRGGLLAEFFIGSAMSDFQRGDKRTSWSYNYGQATMQVLPNGLWNYTFPNGFNQADPALYGGLRQPTLAIAANPAGVNNTRPTPAYTVAQQPLQTQAPQITFTPRIGETAEHTAKLDLSYQLPEAIPFFKKIKTGFNLRDTSASNWGAGGYTAQSAQGTFGQANYVAPIIVPTANVRGSFVGCQDTPGSLGTGGAKCASGFVPSGNPLNVLSGQVVMTPDQFRQIIAASMTDGPTAQFFGGAKDRPAELINGWNQIDVEKVFAMAGHPNVNFDCVKECTANDGKVYQQPVNKFSERASAGYFMTDFGLDHIPFTNKPLPFGVELDGNVGVRYVRTRVKATGTMSFQSILKNPATYNPATPNAAAGVFNVTTSRNTSFEGVSTDIMPTLNLGLWLVPDKVVVRYYGGKTVARPPVSYLLPAGTCTFDERIADGDSGTGDQRCGGTVGNPALLAQRNKNQEVTLEWYPNKDTSFSLAAFHHKGVIGPAVVVGKSDIRVYDGTSDVDPVSGIKLADLVFDYSTRENGPAITKKGWEFGSKTAFTFLPSVLRHTGMDLNYTKLQSATSSVNIVDLITGDPLPPARESAYSYNAALWYDDGKLSARVALQAVASYFTCIAACGANTVNNYPNAGGGRVTVLPYNPGSPNFKDATRFIDAKIAYKLTKNVEVFAEARNLGLATTSNSQGKYSPFADGTPNLLDTSYYGRRIMIGVNIRSY